MIKVNRSFWVYEVPLSLRLRGKSAPLTDVLDFLTKKFGKCDVSCDYEDTKDTGFMVTFKDHRHELLFILEYGEYTLHNT